ncbi:BQ2448_5808 [Microbotryum intermedium]|uniref:BQ2448_5808 protein n=1 Tax=Microbotryum intermedium TaxID=269621 RepID=A0A238EZ91_9BASI|nr:BQ2448_5808 [Microbotryum intermedium]
MSSEKQPTYNPSAQQYQGEGQQYVVNQPMGMAGMSVDPLNPLGLARDQQGKRKFNTTCCGTMSKSPGFCIAAWCVPCMTFGTNKTKYSALKANQVTTDDDRMFDDESFELRLKPSRMFVLSSRTNHSPTCCYYLLAPPGYVGGNCCAFYMMQCIGLGCILDLMLRGDLRERAGIEGSGCGDCMMSCFCLPCSQTQQHLEIVEEERVRMAQLPPGIVKQTFLDPF